MRSVQWNRLVCLAFFVIVIINLGGCGAALPKVTVNGITVSMKDTMQDIMDAGMLSVDHSGHRKDTLPSLSAREVSYDQLSLGIPTEPDYEYSAAPGVGVNVLLYNDSSSSVKGDKGQVHGIYVNFTNPYNERRGEYPVLINGIDFNGLTAQEAIEAMEGLGLKYKGDSEDYETMLFNSGNYRYTIRCEKQGGTFYVTDVEIKMDLDLDIK